MHGCTASQIKLDDTPHVVAGHDFKTIFLLRKLILLNISKIIN
jgi:hypothetical protein